MYLGVTAAVQLFGQEQIKGLREIPRDKLLMERQTNLNFRCNNYKHPGLPRKGSIPHSSYYTNETGN
jgi:hypothetical protein